MGIHQLIRLLIFEKKSQIRGAWSYVLLLFLFVFDITAKKWEESKSEPGFRALKSV